MSEAKRERVIRRKGEVGGEGGRRCQDKEAGKGKAGECVRK